LETDFLSCFIALFNPFTLLLILSGTIIGLIVGVIPGLGSIQGIVLVLPLTYTMRPEDALVMLCAIYCASVYGGSIPAILFNMPGTESAVMTTMDGYKLARKGEAGLALGTAMLCSAIGGIFGVAVLQTLAPTLANVALEFGPAEYFALGFLGLSCVSSIGTKSQVKGLLSAMLGLFVATIGIDKISGVSRFTFGIEIIQTGIEFTPAIIGMYAIGELINQVVNIRQGQSNDVLSHVKVSFLKIRDLIAMKWIILRSGIIGTWVGILPGVGASTAAVIAYNYESRVSKKKDLWGSGIIEGIAAPETSNNASVGGAMVPLLSLGIPGSSTAAVLIGAFVLHGLRPGPLLFSTNPGVVNSIIASMYIVNILMIFISIPLIPFVIKILKVPYPFIGSTVYLACITGAIVLGGFSNVWIVALFGVIGFVMTRLEFPLSPAIIALILGPMMETNIRRAIYMSNTGFLELFTRPIFSSLVLLALVSFLLPFFGKKRNPNDTIL
jgi:putative tricarboxylic transport membrane protein